MYTVTRQMQWPDNLYMVEISGGGIDYSNPDALARKYPGEFQEFLDPREAVEVAIDIFDRWKKDSPTEEIYIGYGNTLGCTMPFEASDKEELKRWAEEEIKDIPVCCICEELINTDKGYVEDDVGNIFCSERCSEKGIYEEEVVEND